MTKRERGKEGLRERELGREGKRLEGERRGTWSVLIFDFTRPKYDDK